ncbi:MAG: response regulator, partial [Sphingomicrobium sp.]
AYLAGKGRLTLQPTILIAEDEPINQMLMRAVLMKAGCHTKVATDGAKAVELVAAARDRGRPYSLVLMDLQMPSMDGFEATRQIRDLGISEAELPIVALTARWSSGCARDCRAVGMQDAVPKPLEVMALQQLVERWCQDRAPVSTICSDDHVGHPVPGHSRNKRHLARLLSRCASSQEIRPTPDEVRMALFALAGSAHRSGEHDLAATAAGYVPVFEAAASCDDFGRLARHCIAQLEPLGLRMPANDGDAPWPASC